LYIVFKASCFSPHVNFADLDKLCINFIYLSATYVMCSLNFNLLSVIIPKYLI
jgi:hypothetical protein